MSFTASHLQAEMDRDPVREKREAIRDAMAENRKAPQVPRGPAAQLADRDRYQNQVRRAEGKAERPR